MASANKVILVGHVGKDPEIRSFQNGNRVANFSLATSESWKDKATGERKEKTEWHHIVVLNDNIVNVIEKYVRKGSKLYIEGQLQTREWEKDGVKRYSTEVVLKQFRGEVVLLDSKQSGETNDAPSQSAQSAPDMMDDDIPF